MAFKPNPPCLTAPISTTCRPERNDGPVWLGCDCECMWIHATGKFTRAESTGGATPKTFREGVLEEGQWTGAISAGICWFVNRRDDLSLGECQGLFSKTLFSFSVLTLSFTESLYCHGDGVGALNITNRSGIASRYPKRKRNST